MIPSDIALCDDIAQELRTRWAGKLTAERHWLPDLKAKGELDILRVSVVPGITPSGELGERDQSWELWPVQIGFAKRLQTKTKAELDTLATLVEEIRIFLQSAVFRLLDGRQFEPNGGYEYIARFDPSLLTREEVDGLDKYTGAFLSVIAFEYDMYV